MKLNRINITSALCSVSVHDSFPQRHLKEEGRLKELCLGFVSADEESACILLELRRIDSPMVTGGMTGSVEEGLALTGMGVVGPFTIT